MEDLHLEERTVSSPILENNGTVQVHTKRTSIVPQLLFALSICLLDVACGTMLVWPASALIELQNPNATFTLTQEQGSWVVSFMPIGGIPGSFVAGFLVKRLGRRITGLMEALPLLLHWILIIFANEAWQFYLARFLAGFSMGGSCVVVPMYIFEIAGRQNRALLGALFPLSMSLGALLSLSLSILLDYRNLSTASAGICVLFVICFAFAPETPVYYVIKGDLISARKSIKILHGEAMADQVLEETVHTVSTASRMKKVSPSELLKDKAFIKGIIISYGIIAAVQFCGMNFIMSYTERILMDTGSSFNPKLAANVIFAIQLLAAVLQLFIIERFPRKVLLLQNSILSCLTLSILGLQFLLHWEAGWLPVVCLIIHSISFVWGFNAICPTIGGEVIAPKAKEYAFAGAAILISLLNFSVTKTFPPLVLSIGIGWTFMIFAGCMILSTIHIVFIVPETKGKTLKEIQDELYGTPRRRRIQR